MHEALRSTPAMALGIADRVWTIGELLDAALATRLPLLPSPWLATTDSRGEIVAAGEEGEVVALIAGDESFEGYWRRPDADAAIRDGWYFTGDTGLMDADGDLFVTGRVDDMIITGGENVSPVEIESCLSLHPAVSEVAVAGLPDERWGKIVCAFVKPRAAVEADDLDAFCRRLGLVNFKRPRRYVFVAEIPKSPVGKLLRRKLVAGDYRPARDVAKHHSNHD